MPKYALREVVLDFRYVAYAYAIILALSSIFVLLMQPFPSFTDSLKNSRSTPWGIATSMFIHGDFYTHYLPNMLGLAIFSLIFVTTNRAQPRKARIRRSKVFVSLIFASTILSNILWLYAMPGSVSYGASNAVFAAGGTMMGFSLCNILSRIRSFDYVRFNSRKNGVLYINLMAFAPFFVMLFYFPSIFLSVGPGVNVFAHGIGFLLAFLASFCYAFCDKAQEWFRTGK